jgi:hypothetical protein
MRETTIAEKPRSEGTPKKSGGSTSARPSTTLDAPPGRGLDGEDFIPSSGSHHRHVFMDMTQTLEK